MREPPPSVASFLEGKRLAVAGVSRSGRAAANAIFRKLRAAGHEVFPVNPNASEIEGVRCYPDITSVPGPVHGVVVATHPRVALEIVRQCATCGVKHVWFHRSFGQGSVSDDAVRTGEAQGINVIVGGCPMMYCAPVDVAHRCARWFLDWRGRLPR
jgi:uncharacterized protein